MLKLYSYLNVNDSIFYFLTFSSVRCTVLKCNYCCIGKRSLNRWTTREVCVLMKHVDETVQGVFWAWGWLRLYGDFYVQLRTMVLKQSWWKKWQTSPSFLEHLRYFTPILHGPWTCTAWELLLSVGERCPDIRSVQDLLCHLHIARLQILRTQPRLLDPGSF